jgi:hypothetical protein
LFLHFSSKRGASNSKPSQKCEGFFGFICQTFIKLSPLFIQTKVALIKKSRFLIVFNYPDNADLQSGPLTIIKKLTNKLLLFVVIVCVSFEPFEGTDC